MSFLIIYSYITALLYLAGSTAGVKRAKNDTEKVISVFIAIGSVIILAVLTMFLLTL